MESSLLNIFKTPTVKMGAIGLGSLFLFNMARHHDPKVNDRPHAAHHTSITTMASYVGLGLALNMGMQKAVPLGLKALKGSLMRNGKAEMVASVANMITQAKKNFPLLNHVLTDEAAAMGLSIASIPVAHSVITKVIAHHRRRVSDHGDTSFVPSSFKNIAGSVSNRIDNSPQIMNPYMNGAQVKFSGNLKSYYNTHKALGEL